MVMIVCAREHAAYALLLTIGLLGCHSSVTAPQGPHVSYVFKGRLNAVGPASGYSGQALQIGPEPRYVLVIAEVSAVSGSSPQWKNGTTAIAVHSPARVFGGIEPVVGKIYEFTAWGAGPGGQAPVVELSAREASAVGS